MIKYNFKKIEKILFIIASIGASNLIFNPFWFNSKLIANEVLWASTALLTGPLLYFARKEAEASKVTYAWLHFIAPLVNLILIFTFTGYLSASYATIAFFLGVYAIQTLKLSGVITNSSIHDLLIMTGGLLIIIAMLNAVIFICAQVFMINTGIDFLLLSHCLLLIITVLIIKYLVLDRVFEKESKLPIDKPAPLYAHSSISKQQNNEIDLGEYYKNKIQDCFNTTDIYLNPNLSLDTIAETLNIPRYILPQIFSVYLKVNFYRFVAQYRIYFAMEQIQSGNLNFTLESLAYQCGFNSKTSFNRYFKEITKLTPQQYQKMQHQHVERAK